MPYANKDTQRAAQRQWARRRRASDAEPDRTSVAVVEPLVPGAVRLEHGQDVLDLLARHVHAVEHAGSADELMKARVVAQLASTALRALEVRDLADRVEALEVTLRDQRRREQGRS